MLVLGQYAHAAQLRFLLSALAERDADDTALGLGQQELVAAEHNAGHHGVDVPVFEARIELVQRPHQRQGLERLDEGVALLYVHIFEGFLRLARFRGHFAC
ncbi:hypothetical protein WJ96_07210 [Burkholderia ubonensis]|uniref:Uncharacterized protein n=1 Tax=Burkholderia ubonensis TaxID=101571 RepID=A0AAW3MUK5_9BURK|nr:hypothetical protein [Burkholderia ubonensis]KVP98302.1 hypothetical protein WJ96_07210 [Burkholderia ubonensis]KVZ93000.1 hypothetical protein WL25_18870 [Burkholderia ubonensis]